MSIRYLLAVVLLAAVAAVPATAQETNQVEQSFGPLVSLTKGLINIGWEVLLITIGMDDAQVAFFTNQLGFRKNVVLGLNAGNCTIGSLRVTEDNVTCQLESGGERISLLFPDAVIAGKTLTMSDFTDENGDGAVDTQEALKYLIQELNVDLVVRDSAKAQVMLFAFLIPFAMLLFLLIDFFLSTAMVRKGTATVLSGGIALIAARTGVYTGLLMTIGNAFGPHGFFLSLFSIYLLIAIALWFVGGIRKSHAIAEAQDEVARAAVQGFAYDLQKGLMGAELAEKIATEKLNK